MDGFSRSSIVSKIISFPPRFPSGSHLKFTIPCILSTSDDFTYLLLLLLYMFTALILIINTPTWIKFEFFRLWGSAFQCEVQYFEGCSGTKVPKLFIVRDRFVQQNLILLFTMEIRYVIKKMLRDP